MPTLEPTPTPTLEIDVAFDFVCPWCLIGKRHLATALERLSRLRPEVRAHVRWRSQQLLPDIPLSGVPYQAFYVARLGSAAAVAARRAQVQRAAAAAEIEFAFDRIAVMPNTAAAHALVAWCGDHGTAAQQSALIDRLFSAYFLEGQDIGDPDVLERTAVACGLPGDGVQRHLANAWRGCVRRLERDEFAAGGVPWFVFNRTHALSGAHPPDMLLNGMLQSIPA